MSGEIRVVVHARTPGDGRPGHLRAVGRPAVQAGPGEVLVEVHAALVTPGAPPPRDDGMIVADQGAGVVVALGDGVTDVAVGDSVALPCWWTCGSCPACLAGRSNLCPWARHYGRDVDGWLAEQVVVPARLVTSRPPTLPPALAASVPGVVATAYHAMKRAGVGPGLTVAVVGADAPGLQLVQLAALAGSDVIVVDDRAHARHRAEELGADAAVSLGDGSLAAALTDPVDRVIITEGQPIDVAAAVGALAVGGRAVFQDADRVSSSDLPIDRLVAAELDVVGAVGANPQDVMELFDLAAEGRLVLTTTLRSPRHVDELAAVEAGFDTDDARPVPLDPRQR